MSGEPTINKNKRLAIRIALCVIGIVICGVAVGFFRFAAFGVDPFTTSVCGFDLLIPISYGTVYVIVNAVLLLFALIFDRHYIGLGTIINLFLLGYIADYILMALSGILPSNIAVRIICLVIGVLLLSFSAALYMPADMGVSTYDAVALIMAETWHIGKFRTDRVITDLVCVALGTVLYILSGNPLREITTIVGIGTIITAFFMGPLISFFSTNITKKYLLKD